MGMKFHATRFPRKSETSSMFLLDKGIVREDEKRLRDAADLLKAFCFSQEQSASCHCHQRK